MVASRMKHGKKKAKKKKWKEGLGAGGTWRHEGQIGDGQSDAR